MAKKKRINPHRIPVAKTEVDKNELSEESFSGNYYYAWLLILPELFLIEGMDAAKIAEIWREIDHYTSDPRFTGQRMDSEVRRAERLMGWTTSYQGVNAQQIRSKGGLEAAKRRLQERAVHTSLCLICLAFDYMKLLDLERIRRVFLNANITWAEVQNGLLTYAELQKMMLDRGIVVRDDAPGEMVTCAAVAQPEAQPV